MKTIISYSKNVLSLLTCFLFISQFQAQVFNGSLALTTQAEVDAFSYSEITGEFSISGGAITNLDGLAGLTSIGGNFLINNLLGSGGITNVNGLADLTTVGGRFQIYNCNRLQDLDGLLSLQSVGGVLRIWNNSQIQDLDGLSSLSSVGELYISGNEALLNIDGLSMISTVNGGVQIGPNINQTNVDGLSQLNSVGGDLLFLNNPSMNNIDGLHNLTTVGGRLSLYLMTGISNVNGLSSLTSIGSDLLMTFNTSLENLDGLSTLQSVPKILLASNFSLSRCCGLYPVLNSGTVSSFSSSQNGQNCSSADILLQGPCPPISVEVHYKNAENGSNYLSNSTIKPIFRLDNFGTTPIDLTELTIRYWFTADNATMQSVTCLTSDLNCNAINSSLYSINPSLTGADTYLEVGFSSGTLQAGDLLNTKLKILRSDNLPYAETDDYSFMGLVSDHIFNVHVGLYHNGVLIQGEEPIGFSARTAQQIELVEAQEEQVLIFPNPFQEAFVVELANQPDQPISLRLLNLVGKVVWTGQALEQQTKIQSPNLVPGVYFLQIGQGDAIKTRRLIKTE